MSIKPIPLSPSLEYYRKQAKALLKAVNSGDSARVQAQLPKFVSSDDFRLSDAQWAVAREHGFASWPKFKKHVEDLMTRGALITAEEGGGITPEPMETKMNDTLSPSDLNAPAPPAPPHAPGEPEAPKTPSLPIRDEAVRVRTGKGWDEWFAIFDAAGGANMTHQEIVAIVRQHGAGSWWQQMITVEFERARGKRAIYQSCDGEFRVNASKTINAPVETVFEAWIDPAQRETWLPGVSLTIRKANPGKALRITWHEGENLDVNLVAKGVAKSICAVEHGKLAGTVEVDNRRAYWSAALERLKSLVEE